MDKQQKEFLDSVQDWIADCDIDGRGICFKFLDTDANDLMLICKKFSETLVGTKTKVVEKKND